MIPARYPSFTFDATAAGPVGPVIDVRLRGVIDVAIAGLTTGEVGMETSIDGQLWLEADESVTGAGWMRVAVAHAAYARLKALTGEAAVATATVGCA
ncbi:MAG: hypothetical protein IBJ10_09975 [Phycisphaerales bacterium]|nr:hypothetical protein [Phycisphaerales bacterium]